MGHLSSSGELEVRTATLDSLYEEGIIRPPSFIKMDVEGAEHAALRGARGLLERFRPVILLSEHGTAQHEQCGELLRSLGYDIEVLLDGAVTGDYLVCATARRGAPSLLDAD